MAASGGGRAIALAAVSGAVAISIVAAIFYMKRTKQLSHHKRQMDAAAELQEEEEEEESGEREVRSACCSTDLEKKPQKGFKRVLADNSYTPFKHLKREGRGNELSLKSHPYGDEITFILDNPPALLELVGIHRCPDVLGSYIWVDTKPQLESLAEILSKEKVFAVDTEQHSLRSFRGFTALMQISTQNDDFIIDTIALHDAMSVLHPVFANSSICKIFHGADNDVLWLQRDFHIYVVNLFDTAKACAVLSKPQKSLVYLLETYCGVSTNKMLQLEDWRIRPLSSEMAQYAHTDVHYLMYIAHCLATELETQGLGDNFKFIIEAFRRSNLVCMQLYAKDFQSSPGDSAAASIYSRYSQGNSSWKDDQAWELVRRLCTWRDLMARIHDESLRYILSDQAIFALGTNTSKDPEEIRNLIKQQADLCKDNSVLHLLPPPFPIVEGHMKDICCIFEEIADNPDDVFRRIFQRYLTQAATICPLSAYNFALLSNLNIKLTDTLFSRKNGGKFDPPAGRKTSRELFVQKFSCKAPVYHNCRIYASDGRLLCYCDRRKLDWYLRRELAKIVEHDPPAIMLLFEPKGRPEDEDNDFYIQSKKNICVGCGEKSHYLRYRLIPSCYRIHFPEHLKSHRSHDIVLLCVDCHEIAHSAAERYKREIATEFHVPLFVRKVMDSGENNVVTVASSSAKEHDEVGVSPLQLRTAAMALIRHGSKMPCKRREELIQVIREYFGRKDVSEEDLETALLVGMSPFERRKLEKKRGLHVKSTEERALCRVNTYAVDEMVESTNHVSHKVQIPHDSRHNGSEEKHLAMSFGDFEQNLAEEKMAEEGRVCVVETANDFDDNNEDRVPIDNINALSLTSTMSSGRYAKKLSLLGHGPHGKQVVDYILKEQGEDGILQFCQRWRQVFVDATHPRYLPSGWDVMHSGRREFGKYSVYNPANPAHGAVD